MDTINPSNSEDGRQEATVDTDVTKITKQDLLDAVASPSTRSQSARRKPFRPSITLVISSATVSLIILTSGAVLLTQWLTAHSAVDRLFRQNAQMMMNAFDQSIGMAIEQHTSSGNLTSADINSLNFDELARITVQEEALAAGTFFVANRAGRILAHPNLNHSHPALADGNMTVGANQLGDLVLDSVSSLPVWRDFLLQPTMVSEMSRIDINLYGTDYVIFLQPVNINLDLPWLKGVWFVGDDVLVHRKGLRDGLYVATGAILFGALLAVWIGYRISLPLRQLAVATRQMANFEDEHSTQLPVSRIRETGDLSASFNRMAGSFNALQTYAPKQLVKRLIRDDLPTIQPDEREVAVMFTDIVGFTSLTDGMPPKEVATFLNEHLTILGNIVERQGGTIDKYIGDALMAFWGAPDTADNSSKLACDTAIAMANALERFNMEQKLHGRTPVRIRVGIHTGQALVGNIGAPSRINYTVVGDTVNAAQRIEALAADIISRDAVTILISETVARELPSSYAYVEVGTAALKGVKKGLPVYRLKV